MKMSGGVWGDDQGIKLTIELLKIRGSRMHGGNLTFDPRKLSDPESQKGTIKRSNTLLADQNTLIAVANASTGDI